MVEVEFVLPVPVAELEVTLVGVTTITLEDNEVLDVEDVVLFTLTGPLTPVVFVVVAFVVDVEPLTTVTGPLTPEVPVVSAAMAFEGMQRDPTRRHAKNRSFRPLDFMTLGSLTLSIPSIRGLGRPNLF